MTKHTAPTLVRLIVSWPPTTSLSVVVPVVALFPAPQAPHTASWDLLGLLTTALVISGRSERVLRRLLSSAKNSRTSPERPVVDEDTQDAQPSTFVWLHRLSELVS